MMSRKLLKLRVTSCVVPEVAAAAALAYRHEPEQELDAEHLQIQNYGDARPRGNLDHTRLDPNSTENWYVVDRV